MPPRQKAAEEEPKIEASPPELEKANDPATATVTAVEKPVENREPMIDTPFGRMTLAEARAKAAEVAEAENAWDRLLKQAKGDAGDGMHHGKKGEICEECFPGGWYAWNASREGTKTDAEGNPIRIPHESVTCPHGSWKA